MDNKYSILGNKFLNLDNMLLINMKKSSQYEDIYKEYEHFQPASLETVSYVKSFLKLLVDNNIILPAIFMELEDEAGGVRLEWRSRSNTKRVLTIVFLNNKRFDCFAFDEDDSTHVFEGVYETVQDEADIIFFILRHV